MFNKNNTKNSNTKNSNQSTGTSLKDKLRDVKEIDNKELERADKTSTALEEANKALEKAMESGDPEEMDKAIALAEKAKLDAEQLNDSNTKNEEENEMKEKQIEKEQEITKEQVASHKDRDTKTQKSTVPGMTAEDMKKASENLDKKLESTVNAQKESEKVTAEDVKDAVSSEMIAEGDATPQQVKEASKTPEVNKEAEKVADQINKQEENKSNTPANTNNKNTKELIPKAWQRVSDDGKSLINVITFLGEKVDYSVGMKHIYRFPNLSASDGMNRIVTAKFPKEDVRPTIEEVMFKDYKINIEKYGNSAVCKLYDPDGICMLEFVSLATVIDILQDELNESDQCNISWGTIDQIIKHKRGLKSRIKSLDVNDEPARQRGGAKSESTSEVTPEVKEEVTAEVEAAPTDVKPEEKIAQ